MAKGKLRISYEELIRAQRSGDQSLNYQRYKNALSQPCGENFYSGTAKRIL